MLPTHIITLKQIAHDLKLSTSTISKALRNSPEISAITKEKITAYAKKLNFRHNPTARALKTGSSKTIGVVLSTIENPFFAEVINGIESAAHENGYNICITQSHGSSKMEKTSITQLIRYSVDGLLISLAAETTDTGYLQSMQNAGLPLVFFDRVAPQINTHKVVADNFAGAYQATLHLLNSGCKRIAFMSSALNTSVALERKAGYLQALADKGLAINESLIRYCNQDGESNKEIDEVVNELLLLNEVPDAIFTATDNISTKVFQCLHRKGIRIPQEIALFGFTNSDLVELTAPTLSSIHQPGFDMGKKAAEMLIALIVNGAKDITFQTLVLPVKVYARGSSRCIGCA
jgi:LacI family transcriptional regulator